MLYTAKSLHSLQVSSFLFRKKKAAALCTSFVVKSRSLGYAWVVMYAQCTENRMNAWDVAVLWNIITELTIAFSTQWSIGYYNLTDSEWMCNHNNHTFTIYVVLPYLVLSLQFLPLVWALLIFRSQKAISVIVIFFFVGMC